MRARMLSIGMLLLVAAGFRCPGGEPRVETSDEGGAGGERTGSVGSGVTSGFGGSTSEATSGSTSASPPPPPTFCESECAECQNEGLCQGICEEQELLCGLQPVTTCFGFLECDLIEVTSCLEFEGGCPLPLPLTCKVLCAAMRNHCAEPSRGFDTADNCKTACEAGLAECIPVNGGPVSPATILGCARDHVVNNQCSDEGLLNGCVQNYCSGSMCPSNWIDPDADDSELCPVSNTPPP